MVEHLFSMGKALGSIPSTVKRGHQGQGREERGDRERGEGRERGEEGADAKPDDLSLIPQIHKVEGQT